MFANPTVVGETVYIGSCAGTFFALDLATGAERWRYGTAEDGIAQFHGDPVLAGELLIVPSDREPRGFLYAFELKSGTLRWKVDFEGGVSTTPIHDGGRLYAVTQRGEVVAIEASTGAVRWRVAPAPPADRPAGAAALVGERLIVPTRAGDVVALAADSGRELWRIALGTMLNTSAVPWREAVYLGGADGLLHRIDLATGAKLGSLPTGGVLFGRPVPLGECLLALSAPGTLACYEPDLRARRWTVRAERGWTSWQPRVVADTIYAGTEDGDLLGLGLDGTERLRHELGDPPRGLGGTDRMLVVGTLGGEVYGFALSSTTATGKTYVQAQAHNPW